MWNAIGWVATAVFSASYFSRQLGALRRIQAAAACLWIVYGLALGAYPVVIANVLVALAALYSWWREEPDKPPMPVGGANHRAAANGKGESACS